jgi:type I restriction enzyme R subunit
MGLSMTPEATSEAACETLIESHLLSNGYVAVDRTGFDCEWALFPGVSLGFIRETQPKEWCKLESAEEGLESMQELSRSVAKRGKQANISSFAFTRHPAKVTPNSHLPKH